MITFNGFIPLPQCCCHPEMAAICYLAQGSACFMLMTEMSRWLAQRQRREILKWPDVFVAKRKLFNTPPSDIQKTDSHSVAYKCFEGWGKYVSGDHGVANHLRHVQMTNETSPHVHRHHR